MSIVCTPDRFISRQSFGYDAIGGWGAVVGVVGGDTVGVACVGGGNVGVSGEGVTANIGDWADLPENSKHMYGNMSTASLQSLF